MANKVIAVSKYEYKGLLRFIKEKKLVLIYNLISSDFKKSKDRNQANPRNKILTISNIDNTYYRRKGLDTFIKAAIDLPHYNFIIVGKNSGDGTSEIIKNSSPPNLKYLGYIDNKSLVQILNETKVYCQLSRQEGFGVALGEAMLMGCMPVVSAKGSIPEVAGPDAFYINEKRNPEMVAALINKAMSRNDKLADIYVERVKKLFHPIIRKKKIISLIDKL